MSTHLKYQEHRKRTRIVDLLVRYSGCPDKQRVGSDHVNDIIKGSCAERYKKNPILCIRATTPRPYDFLS